MATFKVQFLCHQAGTIIANRERTINQPIGGGIMLKHKKSVGIKKDKKSLKRVKKATKLEK